MLGIELTNRTQRHIVGIILLLLVAIIWVASSELTKYIFQAEKYPKPFFSTYLKNSMFMLYLFGFLLFKQWRDKCKKPRYELTSNSGSSDEEQTLSEPIYVPLKFERSSSNDSNIDYSPPANPRRVRFNRLSEVRCLSESVADDASLARLSYAAYQQAQATRLRNSNSLPAKQVAKIACLFSIIYFLAQLSYQEALDKTGAAGIVNVLSSTSSVFTLILAAIFPSNTNDKFTLSKLVCVLFGIGGVTLVCFSELNFGKGVPMDILWSLFSALMYAIYLVLLKRRVDHEDKLNVPMFFGFVGLFICLLLWPGYFILDATELESFRWPDKTLWLYLIINGLIGTVLSDLFWLWGCFLTSSLVGTFSLSLTVPLTMLADIIVKSAKYKWPFYVGTIPIIFSFFAITFLSHFDNYDPVLLGFKKCCQKFSRRSDFLRPRDGDREQTERLIQN